MSSKPPKAWPNAWPNTWDDAEGREEGEPCPECGSDNTITYVFYEGFSELECRRCGYSSEQQDITELACYSGELLEGDAAPPRMPVKKLEA